VQPKIDGVRAIFLNGKLTGRSLDPFKGYKVAERFSNPEFEGLDGEMIYGDDPASSERLCSLTTGAMSRFKGVTEPAPLSWHVFDLLDEVTINLPYAERYAQLQQRVAKLAHSSIRLVPVKTVNNLAELEAEIAGYAEAGYEGTIIRNPDAQYKAGRPTKRGMELLRVKPWQAAEILVTGLTEGNSNENEATTNSLGRTERSSAQDGMVPNGRVGSIQGVLLEDMICAMSKRLLFFKGLAITVSKGEMTTAEAAYYWQHPEKIVGHVATFHSMTHGIKDLPRFPIFKSLRMKEDM
jgi:DNA ligase-1